jgi:hypothetical protein
MWVRDDGGRHAAGFKGATGDCVVRAIAIAGELPYAEVYDALHRAALADPWVRRKLERRHGARAPVHASPRAGVHRRVYDRYLFDHGWTWTPTMKIGQGCTVHLRADELPSGPAHRPLVRAHVRGDRRGDPGHPRPQPRRDALRVRVLAAPDRTHLIGAAPSEWPAHGLAPGPR